MGLGIGHTLILECNLVGDFIFDGQTDIFPARGSKTCLLCPERVNCERPEHVELESDLTEDVGLEHFTTLFLAHRYMVSQ